MAGSDCFWRRRSWQKRAIAISNGDVKAVRRVFELGVAARRSSRARPWLVGCSRKVFWGVRWGVRWGVPPVVRWGVRWSVRWRSRRRSQTTTPTNLITANKTPRSRTPRKQQKCTQVAAIRALHRIKPGTDHRRRLWRWHDHKYLPPPHLLDRSGHIHTRIMTPS